MDRQVMFKDPFGWFPNSLFTNLFPILFLGLHAIDYIVPRFTNPNRQTQDVHSDRGSHFVILIAIFLAISISIFLRIVNVGTSTGLFQWLGLLLMMAGTFLRQWALIKLGRFFSRTVQIETEHEIIADGPYRWIRHPAYTGMILIYVGITMSIGTWLGALLTFIIVTGSLLYRIRVEEAVLLSNFGNDYRSYMEHTWLLFPGW